MIIKPAIIEEMGSAISPTRLECQALGELEGERRRQTCWPLEPLNISKHLWELYSFTVSEVIEEATAIATLNTSTNSHFSLPFLIDLLSSGQTCKFHSSTLSNKSPPVTIRPAMHFHNIECRAMHKMKKTSAKTKSHIRIIRESHGMTRRELAAGAGISENYIYKIENGLKIPTLSTLHRIAIILKVKPSLLIDLPLHDLREDIGKLVDKLDQAKQSLSTQPE